MTDVARDGFLLIDKAGSWTSHDVVAKVRSTTRQRKVGHAGTLDPMATGLLVLGIGRATRLLRFVQSGEKEYVARILFGVATDSLDADGAILSREPMPISQQDLVGVMERFVGTVLQVPPMVSARRVEGRRLYELAREGKEVERDARPVQISELALVEFAPSDYPEAEVRVRCSTGTYVRTLADDIAMALGGRAHLTALRRTRNGSLSVTDAVPIEELAASSNNEAWTDHLITPAAGLGDLPAARVDEATAPAVRNGLPLTEAALGHSTHGLLRITDETGRLLAVYRNEGGMARPEVVLS